MQRSGQTAAMMFAVRAPQSKPARIACSISSASMKAITSSASAACWPLRNVSFRQEARRAEAPEVRSSHSVPRCGKQRCDVGVAVNVVWPAVQQHHRRAIGRAGLDIANVQEACVDLLDDAERRLRRCW